MNERDDERLETEETPPSRLIYICKRKKEEKRIKEQKVLNRQNFLKCEAGDRNPDSGIQMDVMSKITQKNAHRSTL